MMTPRMFWIEGPWPGRLAISARPQGGDWLDDEVAGWRREGVDAVVSLLAADEEHDLGLENEGRAARSHGIHFRSFPVADRGVPPSTAKATGLLEELRADLQAGKTVAVHCRQGIGRSSLIAAGLLVSAGINPAAAFSSIGSARGLPVPETAEQRTWVERLFADHPALVQD